MNPLRHFGRNLWTGIGPSEGLYLHRTTKHRKTRVCVHVSRGIRTHDPSVRGVHDTTRFRLFGHWDRQSLKYHLFIFLYRSRKQKCN